MTEKINFKIIAETEDEVMDFINCHDMNELKDDIDFTLSYEDKIIGSRPISETTEKSEKDAINLYELEELIDERY